MSRTELPFSSAHYSKHTFAVFPTIRRRDKYGDVGDVVDVVIGQDHTDRELAGTALIIAKEQTTLADLPDAFLMHDTETRTRREAEEYLQSFYQTPIEMDEALTLYWCRWTDGTDTLEPVGYAIDTLEGVAEGYGVPDEAAVALREAARRLRAMEESSDE